MYQNQFVAIEYYKVFVVIINFEIFVLDADYDSPRKRLKNKRLRKLD